MCSATLRTIAADPASVSSTVAAAASTVSAIGLIGRSDGCGSEERICFMSPVSSLQKEFVKTFNSICHSRSKGSVFSDWLEIAAVTMHQLPYHSDDFPKDDTFNALEAKYMERIKGYSSEKLNGFSKMLGCTMMTHQKSFGDFLGAIASDLETMDMFAAPKSAERKRTKQQADITLPTERQMDLLSNYRAPRLIEK